MSTVDYGAVEKKISLEDGPEVVGSHIPNGQKSYVPYFIAVGSFALIGLVVFASNITVSNIFTHSTKVASLKSRSSKELTWTLYRDGYSPLSYFTSDASSFLKYKFLKGYDAVIEPGTKTGLFIEGYPNDETQDYHYIFSICASDTSSHHSPCAYGNLHSSQSDVSTVSIDCTLNDDYDISIIEYDASGTETGTTASGTAKCMYVRREIRELTDEDLKSTMDAMATLWYTNEDDGIALYGEDFHNATYFISAHYFGASQQDADHIHEGLGFLLNHIKLSNIFEMAMQAVDPRVTLPYWDFTIDAAAGTSIFDNFIFQPDTFGTLTPPNDDVWGWTYRNNSVDDAIIPDGRWAKLKTDYNHWYPSLRTGYSYLRAPWNMNPSQYLTRFATENAFPACSSYMTWMKKTELMMFLKYAPGPPHARTHGNVGGVFGCDKMDFLYENGMIKSQKQQRAFCSQWGFKMKDLYRYNYLKAKTDCTPADDSTSSTCGFHCVYTNMEDMLDAMKDIMGAYIDVTMSDEDWEELQDFICAGEGYQVFYGDHLESASAADPSFWPIHPTQDRAMQARMMAGGFEDSTWYTSITDDWICGRPECYLSDVSEDLVYDDQCCLGHFEEDGFLDFVSANKTNTIGLTNGEQVTYMDPMNSNYKMRYIYDDFDWSHCGSDSDIDDMLIKLYAGEILTEDDDFASKITDDNNIFSYFFDSSLRK